MPYTGRNPEMKNGIHAVSIDERRCYFRNNLWGEAFPGQNLQQVWFAGVHSDVGGSYPHEKIGLSQITLQWMLYHATRLDLLVDPARVRKTLGRTPPAPPIPPNAMQQINRSLHGFWWWLLEFLPHSYYDSVAKKKSWRIPLGARRSIPPDSAFHSTVHEKIERDVLYKPTNLPPDWMDSIVPFLEKDLFEDRPTSKE